MKIKVKHLFIFSMTIYVISCISEARPSPQAIKNLNVVKEKYYYEIRKEKLDSLVKKMTLIKHKSSHKTIIALLGKPTYNQPMADKRGNPRGRFVKYYLKKLTKNLVSEKYDVYINFIFDNNDELKEVYFRRKHTKDLFKLPTGIKYSCD